MKGVLGNSRLVELEIVMALMAWSAVVLGDQVGAMRATGPAAQVNPFVGTSGGGNLFPGPDFPFGMIQWGPDTSPDRPPGGGYEYNDRTIRGFSLTHLSGVGCPAYGDVPVLPMTGALPAGDPANHVEPFSHLNEVAEIGYYSVNTGTNKEIRTELTTALRGAMARFTFPATKEADLLFKLMDGQMGTTASQVALIGDREITGSSSSGAFCGVGGKYTVYFDIVFDYPFTHSTIQNSVDGKMPNVAFLTFDTTRNQVVQASAGISFVSVENARANRLSEIPDGNWNFDALRSGAVSAWNSLLEKIEIGGASPVEHELFYTSLYHALLHPNVFSDVNGQYIGFDQKIHTISSQQQAQYANYSGWDIYHGQAQLSALVAPRQMSDSAQSMINDASQNSGQLPKWALANSETYIMVGDPADGILGGYYAFGARAFDTQAALTAMVHQGKIETEIRPGLDYEDKLGFLPDDATYGCCNFYGSVATLLEYSIADYAIAHFASALGDSEDYRFFLRRSQNWQNILDPTTGFLSPKRHDGTFLQGTRETSTIGMVEGSASQYRWIIPFNRRAQINALGGVARVNSLLDAFFVNLDDFSGVGDLLSNEFDIGTQYWYNYTGEPWKTQEVVNRIRTQLYADKPLFIDNNDDLGAMASQLVWAMLGVSPIYPGRSTLAISGPEFPLARIHLPKGGVLSIKSNAAPSQPYIQSLMVNGHVFNSVELDESVLNSGAELEFNMGSAPNPSWGTAPKESPALIESTAAIGFAEPSLTIVAPDSSAMLTIGAQSTRDDLTQTISWSAQVDSPRVSLSQSAGTFHLDAGARLKQILTLTAPKEPGWYRIGFHLSSSTGVPIADVVARVGMATIGAIWPLYNQIGITADGVSAGGSLDGGGFSYSAQALAAAGIEGGKKITARGMEFTWPELKPGEADSITASGQTIPASGNSQHMIGLLGCSTNATGQASGILTVHYADQSKQEIPLAFNDWAFGEQEHPLPAGTQTVASMPYRNTSQGGKDMRSTYLFSFTAVLSSSKPVESITLPVNTAGQINIFDVELQ